MERNRFAAPTLPIGFGLRFVFASDPGQASLILVLLRR
jgi:hypothetical protein